MLVSVLLWCIAKMNNFPACLQLVDKYLVVPDLSTALSLDRPKNQKTSSLASGKFFYSRREIGKKGDTRLFSRASDLVRNQPSKIARHVLPDQLLKI
jgi:hypothetical protein